MYVCVCMRSVSLRVCVYMCDFSRFLVEVTDNSQPVDSEACVSAAGLSERLRETL